MGVVSGGSTMVGGSGEVGVFGVKDSLDERRNPEFSSITLLS